jgi:hypothetical protein
VTISAQRTKRSNLPGHNLMALQDGLYMSYISKHLGQQTVQPQLSCCKIRIWILPF